MPSVVEVQDDFYERIRPKLYRRIGREISLAHRVLDLGCGKCALAEFLSKAYHQRVTGVDVAGGRSQPHDGHGPRHSSVRCIQADAADLEFVQDRTMDAVVTTWALHEIERPQAALAEACRVLRPGGRLLVVDFLRGSLAQRLWNEEYFTSSEVRQLLLEAGFRRVRARNVFRNQVIWSVGSRPPENELKVSRGNRSSW